MLTTFDDFVKWYYNNIGTGVEAENLKTIYGNIFTGVVNNVNNNNN